MLNSLQLSFLTIGNSLLGLQIVPYNYLLASGNTKVNNILGIINIPLLLIILPPLIIRYGIKGAAFSFFVIMFFSTFGYIAYFYYKEINRKVLKWLFLIQ